MALAVLILIIVCLWMAWRAWRGREEAEDWFEARGLPSDSITIGQDLVPDPRWANGVSLSDQATGLRGRIDHLMRSRDGALAISEFKLAQRLPAAAHEKDELQVGVYFLLCARDRQIGQEPAYGLIHYRDLDGIVRSFRIENTPALRDRVLTTLSALRAVDVAARKTDAGIRRSHDHRGRCRGCGWYNWCEDRLE